MGDFTTALNVVLAAYEVPHEVAPVHIVELVVDEETHIFHKCGLHLWLSGDNVALLVELCGGIHGGSHHAYPFLVLTGVCTAVHSREEHVELWRSHIFVGCAYLLVAVGLRRVGLHLFGIESLAFFLHRLHCALAVVLIHHAGVERLSVEQRSVAILLAVEVATQCKHVVGRVLIHWCLCIRADKNECIR